MKKIHNALRRIGLALNVSNNTITTDDINAKVTDISWRINHSQELKDLEYLKQVLVSSGIALECDCCNKKGEK